MKLFCQAIRAVTVEFCGVALVVWLLLGFASLGIRGVEQPVMQPIGAIQQDRPILDGLAGIIPTDKGYFDTGYSFTLASQ